MGWCDQMVRWMKSTILRTALPPPTPVSSTHVKQTFRWLLNGLTVFSFVIALGVAGSWGRSYWRNGDDIHYMSMDRKTTHSLTELYTGRIMYAFLKTDVASPSYDFVRRFNWSLMNGNDNGIIPANSFYGIRWEQYKLGTRGSKIIWVRVSIPHAYLLLLFSTLPAIRGYRLYRRRSQFLPGHCVKCGYDLRGTPERCPECGTVAG